MRSLPITVITVVTVITAVTLATLTGVTAVKSGSGGAQYVQTQSWYQGSCQGQPLFQTVTMLDICTGTGTGSMRTEVYSEQNVVSTSSWSVVRCQNEPDTTTNATLNVCACSGQTCVTTTMVPGPFISLSYYPDSTRCYAVNDPMQGPQPYANVAAQCLPAISNNGWCSTGLYSVANIGSNSGSICCYFDPDCQQLYPDGCTTFTNGSCAQDPQSGGSTLTTIQ